MLQGHGNDISQYSELNADFSSNVWYKGLSDELVQVLKSNLSTVVNYPEPTANSLKEKIARCIGVEPTNIVVTNGSTEAFYLIAQVFAGHHSEIIYPCFSEYSDACGLYNHQIEWTSNSIDYLNKNFANKLFWLANPNNPDAKTLSLNEIKHLLNNNPSAIVIVDEAYIELCYNADSAIPLLTDYPNLILVKSFTKAFAIPGIRLGYIVASSGIVERISRFLLPWNVNSLAIVAGSYILDHYNALLPDKEVLKVESIQLQNELRRMNQLKVYPSCCNFFLVQSSYKPAHDLKSFLLENSKILIRDASNFKGLNKSFFRVSVQSDKINRLLIDGIKKWMES